MLNLGKLLSRAIEVFLSKGEIMKVALGLITKYINSNISVMDFVRNANEFGHEIDALIICYSHGYDRVFVENLEKEFPRTYLIKVNHCYDMEKDLRKRGIKSKDFLPLIYADTLETYGLLPYSTYRNSVLIKAMLLEMDALFFVDTDVYPLLLRQGPRKTKFPEYISLKDSKEMEDYQLDEVDFFGRHLEHLKKEDVMVTTSDYSGYYIIPPMNFEHLEDYLGGLQKESALGLVKGCSMNGCKNFSSDVQKPFVTDKFLGGNMAIKLKAFKELPPFFSTTYIAGSELVLSRGEDTLMGTFAKNNKLKSVDIDTLIFHNTYSDFPTQPDILNNKSIRDRFYYASVGWIGRNPFMNYINGNDYKALYEEQRELLIKSSVHTARYLKDRRFLIMPNAIESAMSDFDRVLEEYELAINGFNNIKKKLIK